MARSIRYHPDFYTDVLGAAQWYDERQTELGNDFVTRVRKAASDLIADPGRRTPMEYGMCYWPIGRFPYVVFYDFTKSEIIILGVMHTSQQPEKWRARRG
jgi:plasmid stabilization system protein ParE